jgi:hypothetical protein
LGLWLTKQNSVRRLRVVLYQRMVILWWSSTDSLTKDWRLT